MNIPQQYPVLSQCLAESMQQLGGIADHLPKQIDQAAHSIAEKFINGHKLLILAPAGTQPFGQIFCHNLIHRQADIRPPMPVLLLDSSVDTCTTDSIANEKSDAFFRQAQALANNNDALLLLNTLYDPSLIQALAEFNQNKDMSTIYIGPTPNQQTDLSNAHTTFISLENTNIARVQEMTLFILNCLSDMIDGYVFGSC